MTSEPTAILDPDDVRCPVALLLIDVINSLDFPNAEALLKHAMPMAERIQALKAQAKRHGVPVIYVNDNFGRWRSDFRSLIDDCLRPETLGRPIAERLRPDEDDYFVLKPMHSGFYLTPLEILLARLEAKTLILTGMATNICVFFTANDAHMRGYQIVAPSDCSAAESADDHQHTLAQLHKVMQADISPSTGIDFPRLLAGGKS
ncbi:Isochorismatase [Caulifigura coniformis]|uniref:Isochorismatase n=1 Tax=Caulifigura coniformis TaxID=2527983 RepID=A0A517SDW3_9PLAN|nr:isochorismatase family cysteine hydrolase [Caulifigura coniformis]QDT54314.1 Isochorismatase [Caulifigura coniformis]